jgi:haloalkane dehalogenase
MKAYLDPHCDPANRKMLWVWPQELPIENDPKDTATIVKDYVAKLDRSQVPKLLFWAKPGAIVPEETVALCRSNFSNLEDVFLGESGHYIAEDFSHEIGEKIASWVEGFD